jgi:hypothetical protein
MLDGGDEAKGIGGLQERGICIKLKLFGKMCSIVGFQHDS